MGQGPVTVSLEHRMRVVAHLAATMPGRVRPLAPVGSLLKRPGEAATRARFALGRKPRVIEPTHLEAVRACPCLRCGLDPCGEAAHVRLNCAALGKRTGIGEKPSDQWAVPLCRSCHLTDADAQHRVGEIAFWNAVGLNPLRVAQALHRASSDLVAMRAVVHVFIATRG